MGICSRHSSNEYTVVLRETSESQDIQPGANRRQARRRFCCKWITLFLLLILTTFVVIAEVYLNLDTPSLIHKVLNGEPFHVAAVPARDLNNYLVEYPHEYHFTINEPEKCEQQKPFLVLIVPVVPHNRADRDIIRRTWGGEGTVLGKVVTLFFLLGQQTGEEAEQIQQRVLQESKEHRDLIQSDFLDCYKNLTIKTMVMMEWLAAHCSSATYAMKIDSDIFLNLNNLITMLLNAPQSNYMTGSVTCEALVSRNPASKWYLPVETFPEQHYPCYALGLGYVLSLDLPQKLVEASRHVTALYIEDVYLGMCMRYLHIPSTFPPSWNSFSFSPLPYDRCIYSELIATTTPEHTDHLRVWRDFKSPGPPCVEELREGILY